MHRFGPGSNRQPQTVDGGDPEPQYFPVRPGVIGDASGPIPLASLTESSAHALGELGAAIFQELHLFAPSQSVMPVLAWARMGLARPPKGGERKHGLPGQLVVSLTSHPRRFRTLALTLRSLLQQTVRADRTILWVTNGDKRLLPQDVLDLRKAGLEIRAADDTRSYMKILPALDAFPDAFICTADDDTYYWPTWLQELTDEFEAADPTVTCHRANGITVDERGRLKPYTQWHRHVRPRGKAINLFPTGCMGVLYPPGTLDHVADDRTAALERCPLADDVWLYWIGQRNGAQYKTVARRRPQITWPGSQRVSLWSYNARGGNDLQILHMAEKYGHPAILAKIAEAGAHQVNSSGPSSAVDLPASAWVTP